MPTLYHLLGVYSPCDPTARYVTSWLISPTALATLRLILSLYAFVTLFFIYGFEDSHGNAISARQSFSFFTDLTYWGIAFYLLFAGLHTLSFALNYRKSLKIDGLARYWLQRWPRPLQAAHMILYSTIVTFPFLVTIVFWAIIYSPPWFPVRFQAWQNVSSFQSVLDRIS